MGEASGISLKAIGKQDTYLLSDKDDDLPFLPKSKRHSEFIKYHRVRNVTNPGQNNNWPFGNKIKLEFKPQNMGDLLSNMWLSLTLPKLETDYRNDVTVTTLTETGVYEVETEVERTESFEETRLDVPVVPPDIGGSDSIVFSKIIETTDTTTSESSSVLTDNYIRTDSTTSVDTFYTVNQTYESSTTTTSTSDGEPITVSVTTNPFQTTTIETTLNQTNEYNADTPENITIDTFDAPTEYFFDDALNLEPYSSIQNKFGQNLIVSSTGFRYFVPNNAERTCTVFGVNEARDGVAKESVLKMYKANGLSNGEKYRLCCNGFGDTLLAARRYKIGVKYIENAASIWEPRIVTPRSNEILINSFNYGTRTWSSEPLLIQPTPTANPYLDLGHGVALSSDGLTIALGTIFCGGYNSNDEYIPFMSCNTNSNNIVIFKYSNGEWNQHSTIRILGPSTDVGLYYFKPVLNRDATRLAVSYYKVVPTNTTSTPSEFVYDSPTVADTYLKVYDFNSNDETWTEDTSIQSVSVPMGYRSDGDFYGMFISMNSTGTSIAVGAPYHSYDSFSIPENFPVSGYIHFYREGTINNSDNTHIPGQWVHEQLNVEGYAAASDIEFLGAHITICGRGLYALTSSNTNGAKGLYYASGWYIYNYTTLPLPNGTKNTLGYQDQAATTGVFVGDDEIIYVSKFIYDEGNINFNIDTNVDYGDTSNYDITTSNLISQTTTERISNERYETTITKNYQINNVALLTNFADQVGRHIFKSITMYVDEVEVEKIYDDWSILHDELYIEMSEKVTNAYLLNRNLRYDSATLPGVAELARYETDLMIPIPFFFSRKYTSDEYSINEPNRPYFPLCLVHKQKIEFEIEFHKQSFFTDSYQSIQLRDFDIITEEITISNDERIYMMKNPIKIITNFVKKHPTTVTEIGKNTVRNNLVPNIPVKCLHWFFRRQDFENEDVSRQEITANQDECYYQNRFNFSTSPTFSVSSSFFGHAMKYAYLYLLGNKLPNIRDANYNYYKYKIPLDVRLTRPNRNIYTYSFAIRPMNTDPSGMFDFSEIHSDKTVIENELVDTANVYSMHMYYTGYQTMQFENGFMSFV